MKFTSFSHFFTPLRCCNDINPPLHAQGQTSLKRWGLSLIVCVV